MYEIKQSHCKNHETLNRLYKKTIFPKFKLKYCTLDLHVKKYCTAILILSPSFLNVIFRLSVKSQTKSESLPKQSSWSRGNSILYVHCTLYLYTVQYMSGFSLNTVHVQNIMVQSRSQADIHTVQLYIHCTVYTRCMIASY